MYSEILFYTGVVGILSHMFCDELVLASLLPPNYVGSFTFLSCLARVPEVLPSSAGSLLLVGAGCRSVSVPNPDVRGAECLDVMEAPHCVYC